MGALAGAVRAGGFYLSKLPGGATLRALHLRCTSSSLRRSYCLLWACSWLRADSLACDVSAYTDAMTRCSGWQSERACVGPGLAVLSFPDLGSPCVWLSCVSGASPRAQVNMAFFWRARLVQ